VVNNPNLRFSNETVENEDDVEALYQQKLQESDQLRKRLIDEYNN
jgi:hypothetical protein